PDSSPERQNLGWYSVAPTRPGLASAWERGRPARIGPCGRDARAPRLNRDGSQANMAELRNNILESIGRTPLVRLNRVTEALGVEIYAKCEFLNPGGSVKDRIGVELIEDAERRGLLRP